MNEGPTGKNGITTDQYVNFVPTFQKVTLSRNKSLSLWTDRVAMLPETRAQGDQRRRVMTGLLDLSDLEKSFRPSASSPLPPAARGPAGSERGPAQTRELS